MSTSASQEAAAKDDLKTPKVDASRDRKRKSPEASDTESENDDSAPAQNKASTKPKEDDAEKDKNWKRIMANRKSARDSRLRRIKYMETLEKSVEELTRENTSLLRENQSMAREIYALRQQVTGGGAMAPADPALGDPTGFRPSALALGARGGPYGATGMLPGAEGAPTTSRLSAGIMSPGRAPGLAAPSRSSLVAPPPPPMAPMDMPYGGMPGGMHAMPPMQDDQMALDMIRRRRAALAASAAPPPTEEEQQLLDAMRRRRGQL